ncbi:MAG: hypothetical protein KA956_15095 [Pyrinomonadaceae bacterium]|nr:hypothetical protein [Acidobacteriota bacterium]MBK7934255.1 hypothetical protein [Acidobacteriota bacterium]MBP7377793.1 hypothetical protein [Pyrinomonadaceae bacterium]
MSKETESAELIMRLFDLRRDTLMRDGRDWFVKFHPESGQDIIQAMVDPKTTGYYQMVVSYWDMAASFVNRGAIDPEMFLETNGEALMVFAKIEPFLEEVRTALSDPTYAKNLETLAMSLPDAKESMDARREMIKKMMEARASMAESAYSR